MKRMIAWLLAVLMLNIAPALAEEGAWEWYRHPMLGYTIAYPEGWRVVESDEMKDFLANAPDSSEMENDLLGYHAELNQQVMFISPAGYNLNISCETTDQPMTAQDMLDRLVMTAPMLQAALTECTMLVDPQEWAFPDRTGAMFGLQHVSGDTQYASLQFLQADDTRLYTFTLTALMEDGDLLDQAIMEAATMMDNFMAAGMPEYAIYEHPNWGYTMECPIDWFCIDSENTDEKIAAFEEMYGEKYASTLTSIQRNRDKIISTDMAMIMNLADYGMVQIMVSEEDVVATEDDAIGVLSSLWRTYQQSYSRLNCFADGEELQIGDCAAYLLGFRHSYQDMLFGATLCYFVIDGTTVYLITATTTTADMETPLDDWLAKMERAVGSFTPKAH